MFHETSTPDPLRWFAAAWLLGRAGKTSWDHADARDIRQWMAHLLDRYSKAHASIQFRALRQFFEWRTAEEDSPDLPLSFCRTRQLA